MNMKLTKTAIDDLNEVYGLDVSAELERILAEELSKSIDSQKIFQLKEIALVEEIDSKIEKLLNNE